MNFRSVRDLNLLIKRQLHNIPKLDAVVGIPRSGMLPASLIALYLGKPLLTIEQLFTGGDYWGQLTNRINVTKNTSNTGTILVIDDSCNTGRAMKYVKERIKTFIPEVKVIYSAIYATEEACQYLDFFFDICPLPRVFEWNIMDHIFLENACVDLDGVLCENPEPYQNDDGVVYLNFIRNTRPKFIPQHKIKAIVTCRLEKYREETETWLKAHNIKYDKLYMMQYNTAHERMRAGNHSKYKAQIYSESETGTCLFIESEDSQAYGINYITHKPVYCLGSGRFYE